MSTGVARFRSGTGWAWGIALLPLLQVAAMQVVIAGFLAGASNPGRRVPDGAISLIQAGFLAVMVSAVLVIGLSGLLARLDQRVLAGRIERPFPWGWGFLPGVYLIGRTVVLRRRVGRGAAPLAVFAGVFAGSTLLGSVEILVLVGEILGARG